MTSTIIMKGQFEKNGKSSLKDRLNQNIAENRFE